MTKKTDPPNPPVASSSPFGASTIPPSTNTTASPSDTIPLATRGRRIPAPANGPNILSMLTELTELARANAAVRSPVSAEAPSDPHEKKSARATKCNTSKAAYWIGCALQVPVDLGPISAACRELLSDIELTCAGVGLPLTLSRDSAV